jgi:hypothetical protein
MAHSYKNIVITPNTGASSDPTVQFSGGNTTVNTDITLKVYPDSNGTLSFEGSAGQLFSITNDLTGSLFSVNDVSGIPLIEVNVTSQQITFGEFYGNVGIGKSASTSSTYKLDVNGTINASNILINGNAITGSLTSLTPANNWANTLYTSSLSTGNNSANSANAYTITVGAASNTWANTLSTSDRAIANAAANSANAYTVTIGAASNTWANTLSTSDRAIANAAANSANAYTVTVGTAGNNYTIQVGAASNTWANTLSTSDRAIANAAANSANAYTVTVGAASNSWANSLGVNTALAYTWTNTQTYQSTVSFSSNVFFRNTSNIVWITNAASTTSNVTLKTYPDSNGTLSFEGSAGQLFSITNDLTGSLFSVNDVSGIPLIEVNVTSQQVTFGQFYGNVGIGTSASTASIYKLDVAGSANISLPTLLVAGTNVLASFAAGNNYTNQIGAAANTWANSKVAAVTSNSTSRIWANTAIDGNNNENVFLDLATSGVTATTYGNASIIPVITVDAYGRITSAANVTSSGGGGGGVTITAETSSASTFYPVFTLTTTGTMSTANVDSTDLKYVPSTGTFSALIFNSTSDITMKTDIEELDGVELIKDINPVGFKWKRSGIKSYGVIAQDLEKVLPELVQTDDEGLKSVSYIPMIAMLVDVVKKQQKEIQEIKELLNRKKE